MSRHKKKNYKRKSFKRRIKRRWKAFLEKMKKAFFMTVIIFLLFFVLSACFPIDSVSKVLEMIKPGFEDVIEKIEEVKRNVQSSNVDKMITIDSVPPYDKSPYVVIHNNRPDFNEEDMTRNSYEYYSELDELGRCGVTMACIGKDIMPTEERGPIGMIRPSGWKLKKYDIVDGLYIYNRCHLIGYQLTGENANIKNLITGTRYMNVEGMLPFENRVADYVKRTGNHVLYRVKPIFEGNNLVAHGVQMEAYSIEDRGFGVSFNVFVYNVQPGIKIDYETGDNWILKK